MRREIYTLKRNLSSNLSVRRPPLEMERENYRILKYNYLLHLGGAVELL
jgi:hypothetical protein